MNGSDVFSLMFLVGDRCLVDWSLEDYLAIAASDERVSKGQVALRQYGPVLGRIEAQYGVDADVVAAIWGMESF